MMALLWILHPHSEDSLLRLLVVVTFKYLLLMRHLFWKTPLARTKVKKYVGSQNGHTREILSTWQRNLVKSNLGSQMRKVIEKAVEVPEEVTPAKTKPKKQNKTFTLKELRARERAQAVEHMPSSERSWVCFLGPHCLPAPFIIWPT